MSSQRVFSAIFVSLLLICGSLAYALDKPILLPTPKKVTWGSASITLSTPARAQAYLIQAADDPAIRTATKELNARLAAAGARSLPLLADQNRSSARNVTLWLGTFKQVRQASTMIGHDVVLPREARVPDGYIIRCEKIADQDVITCVGYDARGCYYGVQTLTQLLQVKDGKVTLPRVSITDWPSFRIRLIKSSPSKDDPAAVEHWARMMPHFKMNVMASQFQPSLDGGTWRKPSERHQINTAIIGRVGRETGAYDPMAYLGPFPLDENAPLDDKTISEFVGALDSLANRGYRWFGLDFNDWCTDKRVKAVFGDRFKDIGDFMAYVTNGTYKGLRKLHHDAGIISCPAVGYYCYKKVPQPIINYCRAIPDDVYVITTGPAVRSRAISEDWLKQWRIDTGRKPFLWDNTIYSHLDGYGRAFSGKYNLNAFDNKFPTNMPDLVAGGIHLNGSVRPWWEPGVLTFLDYMWNPDAYDPAKSLENAITLVWGKQAVEPAREVSKRMDGFAAYCSAVINKTGTGTEQAAQEKAQGVLDAVAGLSQAIGRPDVTDEMGTYYRSSIDTAMARAFPAATDAKAGK